MSTTASPRLILSWSNVPKLTMQHVGVNFTVLVRLKSEFLPHQRGTDASGDSWATIQWPRSDCKGRARLFESHRRSRTFPLWQTAPAQSAEWRPPLPSVSFSIRGDPLTQALFDHLLLRLEHQAPRPNLATGRLYRVTFEKRHCCSGWEAGWTRDRGCYFDGLTVL